MLPYKFLFENCRLLRFWPPNVLNSPATRAGTATLEERGKGGRGWMGGREGGVGAFLPYVS